MKFIPSRPVTIQAVRSAQRWFPLIRRHTDNSLLLYVQFGYDADFAEVSRWRSIDGGITWHEEAANVPRAVWTHSFADGILFEMDCYGFQDPNAPDTFCYYGAWSIPGSATQAAERALVRVQAPSILPVPLNQDSHLRYPSFPWWPLMNDIHGKAELSGDEVFLGGPYCTDFVEVSDRLVTVGYNRHRDDAATGKTSVFCLESRDRGHNWHEISVVARGTDATPEGYNETAMALLNDGRLYVVLRTGDVLVHAWSSDGGATWTPPQPLRLIDSDLRAGMVWPRLAKLDDGTLVLVYGRPGKHLVCDPTGTGTQWQGRLDLHAWEMETQELMGVPAEKRLRGDTNACIRYWDSADYLGLVTTGPRELLVTYDVQNFVENWNSAPIAGVRMLKVRLDD